MPVTDEAFDIVKTVRSRAARLIGMRPELSLTASALLLSAAALPDIEERVKAYGLRLYSASTAPTA